MAQAEAKLRLDPLGTLWRGVWQLYKERLSTLIVIILVPTVLVALADGIGAFGDGVGKAISVLFVLAGEIAFFWASLALIVALKKGTDAAASYRESRRLFWPYAWISILLILVTIGGFVMLIVPGILMWIWFSLVSFVVVIEDRRGMSALTQSREYTRGYWWALAGRFFLLILAVIAAFVVVGIVFGIILFALKNVATTIIVQGATYLFVVPFAVTYSYKIYENLVLLKPELASNPSRRTREFFIVSAFVGIAAPIILFATAVSYLVVLFSRSGSNGLPFPSGSGFPQTPAYQVSPNTLPGGASSSQP